MPIEIQLGTKLLSRGLDDGLRGMCIGEKRTIRLDADAGVMDMPAVLPIGDPGPGAREERKVMFEVELLSVSNRTTANTFAYLDLDGDKKISAQEAHTLIEMFLRGMKADLGVDTQTLVSFFVSLHDKVSAGRG